MGEKDRNKREEMMEEIVEEKVLSLTVIGIGELGGGETGGKLRSQSTLSVVPVFRPNVVIEIYRCL